MDFSADFVFSFRLLKVCAHEESCRAVRFVDGGKGALLGFTPILICVVVCCVFFFSSSLLDSVRNFELVVSGNVDARSLVNLNLSVAYVLYFWWSVELHCSKISTHLITYF